MNPINTRVSKRSTDLFDFQNFVTVQVRLEIFALRNDDQLIEWVLYTNLQKTDILKRQKKAPLMARECPTLANFKDKVIFASGGFNEEWL